MELFFRIGKVLWLPEGDSSVGIGDEDFVLSAYRKCQPDDFRCGPDGKALCLPKDKRCDGYMDCRNGRDEENCPGFGIACNLDQFRCKNGQRCIDTPLKCNHKNDCGDNSDETDCSKLWTLFFF